MKLEQELTKERNNEMDKWGRTLIYPEMKRFLNDKSQRVLDLINHGLAIVDDELDSNSIQNRLIYLENIISIFQNSYHNQNTNQPSNPGEKAVIDLGSALNELSSESFFNFSAHRIGKHVYNDTLNFWDVEKRNFQRQWKVLNKKELDEITLGIGSFVASQFLYVLDYPRVFNEFKQLSDSYGFAVKLADNLCDFKADICEGYVNVPKEDISNVMGISLRDDKVISIDSKNLALSQEYIKKEYQRTEKAFEYAHRLMLIARARRPIWNKKGDKRLTLFSQFCDTWLNQAKDFVEHYSDPTNP